MVAFYTVVPNCEVDVHQVDGHTLITVNPNFVVNSVLSVSILEANGFRHDLQRYFLGGDRDRYSLPRQVEKGSVLQVECSLQYDRVTPSMTTVRRVVTVQ